MSLIQMSISAAVMIFVITAIRAISINRLPKKTFLALWGLVLVRLLVPFTWPSVQRLLPGKVFWSRTDRRRSNRKRAARYPGHRRAGCCTKYCRGRGADTRGLDLGHRTGVLYAVFYHSLCQMPLRVHDFPAGGKRIYDPMAGRA